MTNLRIACVAIVKNEQNHVAEWIAYQLAIGFDTVIVFDNQSTDDTAARIRAFAPHHDVRLHEWTMTTPDYQTRCYEHAARSYTDEFDWLAFFDIDEFLVLDPGFDLKSILNLFPATPAIGVPWAMFGSSGHTEKPDGLLIEAFTHRSEPSFGPNRHIKSIIRPKHMLYCHNAHSFAMDGQYRSLTGKPLTFTQGGLLDTDPDYTLGKLHHYFTRSRAHWADKMQRGYHDTSREDSEFEAYDRNEIPDDSARDLAPRVREILKGIRVSSPNDDEISQKMNHSSELVTIRQVKNGQKSENIIRLGIGITTYNRSRFLIKNIIKLYEMTSIDFVLIVADDGSTDETRELLEKNRVNYVTGENRGVAWNKNKMFIII
jgi:Glycosyltransferases involved in cell wall biogenesis